MDDKIDIESTDVGPTLTDQINLDGAWLELEEGDAKALLPLIEKLADGQDSVTLTVDELKNSIAYAFMAGVVLEEADMLMQMFAAAGMQDMFDAIDDCDGGDGEGGITDEIGGGTGGSGLH
jgi:hypothetical protein